MTNESKMYCPYPECKGKPPMPMSEYDAHRLKEHPEGIEYPNSVQYYSRHARALIHSQRNKVLKLIEHHCIEYAGDGTFICKPISGYNRKKEPYKLTSTGGGWPGEEDWDKWECDCQWYTQKKEAGEPDIWCAHKGALAEALKRKAEGLYDLGPREGLKA